jgi:HK97 gp10 family phage protein
VAKKVAPKGFKEMHAAFLSLNNDVRRKIAKATTGAGAKVVKERIAELAPVADAPYVIEEGDDRLLIQPKNIARNVIAKGRKDSETPPGVAEHLVLVRGKRKYGYAGRLASMHEFGTEKMSPRPFFRPGAQQAMEPAFEAMRKRFQARIESTIKKLEKAK